MNEEKRTASSRSLSTVDPLHGQEIPVCGTNGISRSSTPIFHLLKSSKACPEKNSPNSQEFSPVTPGGSLSPTIPSQFARSVSPAQAEPRRSESPALPSTGNSGNIPQDSALNALTAPELRTAHLLHKWKYDTSILSLVINESSGKLYAGTQDGKIISYELETYQQEECVSAHDSSVLTLLLVGNNQLVSSGSDSLVKIWHIGPDHLTLRTTIYSLADIGDVFSLAWSNEYSTLYFGAQNTSISWIHGNDIKPESSDVAHEPAFTSLPSYRYDRFFDSRGPGGKVAPQQTAIQATQAELIAAPGTHEAAYTQAYGQLVQVPEENYKMYAHFGYVYAMFVKQDYGETQEDVLVTGGGDGSVKIWSLKQNSLTLLFDLKNEVSVLSLGFQDMFLYCGLAGGEVKIWDLETCQPIRWTKGSEGDILALEVFNNCVFKGSSAGVSKWELQTEMLYEWKAYDGTVLSLKSFRKGNRVYLAVAGSEPSICLYDLTCLDGQELAVRDSLIQSRISKIPMDAMLLQQFDEKRKSVVNVGLENDQLIQDLAMFVSFKSVSSRPDLYIDDCRKCATYLQNLFRRFGAIARLIPTEDGNPIVYACFPGKPRSSSGASTPEHGPVEEFRNRRVLFYGHYDVINASESGEWLSDPFQLTSLDGRLYGRGVSDNKGPVLAAIYAVADLLQSGELENDVVFLIEGEEECGSFGFQETIENYKSLVGPIDWVLLSNSYWLDDDVPCLNYGLRGVISARVEIRSDHPDRHSGMHGGVSPEPTIDLVKILSQLTSNTGKVRIPHFYDTVRPVSEYERKLYDDIIRKTTLVTGNDDSPASVEDLMGKWRFPSLTIHNVDVSGPNNSTVIPKMASANLSVRIVPDQELEEIKQSLVAYIEECFKQLNSDNHLSVNIFHEAEPWLGDPDNVGFQTLQKAVKREWGVDPLFIREGGSIPSVRFLEKTFNAPAAQLPSGQSSDNAHLDNERLRIVNLFKTRRIMRETFHSLTSGKDHKD